MTGILPEIVRSRRDKLGFATPEEAWFRGPLREAVLGGIEQTLARFPGLLNRPGRARTCRRYAGRPPADRFLAVADRQSRHLGAVVWGQRVNGGVDPGPRRCGIADAGSARGGQPRRPDRQLARRDGFSFDCARGHGRAPGVSGETRIEVRSLGGARAEPRRRRCRPRPAGGGRGAGAGAAQWALRSPREWRLYAGFRGYDWWRHCYRPRAVVAAGDPLLPSFFRALSRGADRWRERLAPGLSMTRTISIAALSRRRHCGAVRPSPAPSVSRRAGRLPDGRGGCGRYGQQWGARPRCERTFGRRPVVIRNCHDERRDRTQAPDLRGCWVWARPTGCASWSATGNPGWRS